MKLPLFMASLWIAFGVCNLQAQATNTGSTVKPPEVFLDNHRPLIKKKDKAPTSRNVAGKVVDSSQKPLNGALVTLTNTQTNVKNTFITKPDGRYNFEDLSLTIDYVLQAKYRALSTEVRKISQYDPNVNTVRILEVDTGDSSKDKAVASSAESTKEKSSPIPPLQ